jgi:nucleoid DNA-binding protein
MPGNKKNVIRKNELISRIEKTIPDESKLIGKIIGQIKNARKKSRVRLNINEKQLRVHLSEIIKNWERSQISSSVNKFLTEMKTSWQKKENIVLPGIFSTQTYRTPPRKVKNPQTGRPMTVPAKNRLKIRISSKLKREINS